MTVRPVRRAALALGTLIVTAGIAATPAAAATSAKAANRTTIELDRSASSPLRQAKVTITAAKPGSATSARIRLPVSGLMLENARNVSLTHKPVLTFRRGAKRVRVVTPQLVVSGSRTTVTGVIGTRTVTLFTVATTAKTRTIDQVKGRATISRSTVRLTAAGAKALRSRLGLSRLATGKVGTLTSDADVTVTGMLPFAPVDGPPTPGGATTTAAPATARPIVGGTVRYAPKRSWLGYIAQQGEGASAEDGATFVGSKTSGTYQLPVTGGWYDAASRTGVVETSGTVRYRFIGHQIDVALQNWSWDLAATPKAVALVKDSLHGRILPDHKYVGTRIPLLLTKPQGVTPTVSPDGAQVSWSGVPVTLANEGVPVFLAYLYDSDQGSISATVDLG